MPQVVTAMALLGIIISIAMLVFGNILHQSTSLEDKRISMLLDAQINKEKRKSLCMYQIDY